MEVKPVAQPAQDRQWNWETPIPDAIDGSGAPVTKEEILDRLQQGHTLWTSASDAGQNFVIEGKKIGEAAYLSRAFVLDLLNGYPFDKVQEANGASIYKLRGS